MVPRRQSKEIARIRLPERRSSGKVCYELHAFSKRNRSFRSCLYGSMSYGRNNFRRTKSNSKSEALRTHTHKKGTLHLDTNALNLA